MNELRLLIDRKIRTIDVKIPSNVLKSFKKKAYSTLASIAHDSMKADIAIESISKKIKQMFAAAKGNKGVGEGQYNDSFKSIKEDQKWLDRTINTLEESINKHEKLMKEIESRYGSPASLEVFKELLK